MTVEAGLAVAAFTPDRYGRWRYRIEVADPAAAIERVIEVKQRVVPEPAP